MFWLQIVLLIMSQFLAMLTAHESRLLSLEFLWPDRKIVILITQIPCDMEEQLLCDMDEQILQIGMNKFFR